MIGYLRGTLALIRENEIIVDVQGVGYRLAISALTLSALPKPGSQIQLFTHMQVREDAIALYGFLEQDDLDMFELLIGVSGVGPKAALGILSLMSANDLKFALLSADVKSISKAQGIGQKTAQRVVMELKDKVSLEEAFTQRSAIAGAEPAENSQAVSDAVQGLTALGYSAAESMKAVKSVENGESLDAQQLLKAALKKLF